jgi:hypothetical protein
MVVLGRLVFYRLRHRLRPIAPAGGEEGEEGCMEKN